MPRKKKWPPVPHAHRASGQERFHYGGRTYYLGPIGSVEAKTRYVELLTQLMQQQAQTQTPPQPKPSKAQTPLLLWRTVAEVVALWDAYAQDRYGASGKEAAQFRYSLAPMVEAHAATPVDRFGVRQLDEVRELMIAKGWQREVIGRRMVRVRTMWRWAEVKGHVPPGSWAALSALPAVAANDRRVRRSRPRKAVDWATLAKVCRAIENRQVRAIMLVLWYTGARPSEVRTLKVGDIDRSGEVWTAAITDHKNAWRGQERTIAIGPKAQAVLRPYLEGKPGCAWVFPSGRSDGKPCRGESLSRAVRRACERVVVAGCTPYSCRHSYRLRVTRALSLEHARAAMGHASIETTADYAKGTDAAAAAEAARRLG